jgi:hypothetical protein
MPASHHDERRNCTRQGLDLDSIQNLSEDLAAGWKAEELEPAGPESRLEMPADKEEHAYVYLYGYASSPVHNMLGCSMQFTKTKITCHL